MSIPLLDLARVHAPILSEMTAAAARVLAEGRFIMGPEVQAFEDEAAAYLGAKHAIGVSNGTDALRAVFEVLALTRNSGTVITTPYTFVATAEAVASAGFQVQFVDVDPDTGLLSPEALPTQPADLVGLVPVHLFGQCAPMEPLQEYADRHGLWLVEDAAQSMGAVYDGVQSGAMGTAGCFSFFPSKNLGGAGDGGLVTTNDDDLARYVRAIRVHGVLHKKYHSDFFGGNYRLDALQAAILRVKLPHLDRWNEARSAVAMRYGELFAERGLVDRGLVRPLRHDERTSHVYHQVVVRAQDRDALAARLAREGIGNAVYYPVPLHMQPAFAYLGHAPEDFPNALALSREALALPVFPGLTEAEQATVVDCIAAHYEEAGR